MTLAIEDTLKKLQNYRNSPFQIMSVFLEIPQQTSSKAKVLSEQFKNLVDSSLAEYQVGLLKENINYVDAFLKQYKQAEEHKGLAIFSGENRLWEVVTMNEKLPNLLTVKNSPYIAPLISILSMYRRYLVVLADREKARFFTLHMGQLEAQGGVEDPSVPQRVKGRGSADLEQRIDRHIRDHVNKHFIYIGQRVNDFIQNKQITGVIIGGHKEMLRNIREHLPNNLQKKVVGEFISELNTNMNNILNESKSVVDKVNNRLNQQQVFSPY